jgi:hypothetical protein
MGNDYGHYQDDFLSLHIEYPPSPGSCDSCNQSHVTNETLKKLFSNQPQKLRNSIHNPPISILFFTFQRLCSRDSRHHPVQCHGSHFMINPISNHVDMFHRDIRIINRRNRIPIVPPPSYDQFSAPLRSSICFFLICRNREARIVHDINSLIDLAHQGFVRPTTAKGSVN